MSDALTQSEVESLLSSLDTNEAAPTSSPASHAAVTVYDFKRPERVSKEQMRAFQALHDGFSREFAAGVSGLMRSIVEVRLVSCDQLTYSEFVHSLENPTCFNLLEAHGLDGHFILDLNPAIIYPIVDRLLGGGKRQRTVIPDRPLTEIELRLVSRITDLAVTSLQNAWVNICELKLTLSQTESNPQLVQLVPPNEVVVLLSFEMVMGDARGVMNLCIPFNTIEPLSHKLSSDTWSAYTKKELTDRQKLTLRTGLASASVELVARLAETTLSAGDVSNLAVGDVILTEQDVSRGLTVMVEGRPMFTAQPGLLKGHKAIEIGQHLDRIEDVIDRQLGGAASDG